MKLKRNQGIMRQAGHSQGSWISEDDRWVIERYRDTREWRIWSHKAGHYAEPDEELLAKFGLFEHGFPTRRAAVAALEEMLAGLAA